MSTSPIKETPIVYPILSFEEFIKTRKFVADLEPLGLGHAEPTPGFLYCDYLFIEIVTRPEIGAAFHLVINNSTEVSDDLKKFEKELYEFYKSNEGYQEDD